MSAVARSGQGSARLGATVRGVLVSPATAFVPALKRAETSAEGLSTFVLAALGGAAGLLLWLKVRALVGFRALAPSEFDVGFFVTWIVLAMVIAVIAQVGWSFVASRLGGPDAGSPRSFRAVWALSAFPQIPALLVLAPLDLLLVGRDVFTATDSGDSVALAWTALSTALSVSLAVWSAFVFAQGTHVATRAPRRRSAGVVALSVAAVAVTVGALAALLIGAGTLLG